MKRQSITTNILWNTAGNIFYLGCQWLLSVVVVRISGSYTDAGILTLAISITNIFSTLAAFSIRNYQVSDIGGKYHQSDYISHRIVTCSVAMALCIAFTAIGGYSLGASLSIIAYMLMRTVEAFADVFHGILQMQWRLDIVGRSCIYRGAVLFVSFAIVYKFSGLLPVALLCMAILTVLTFFAYDFRVTGRTIDLSCRFDRTRLLGLSKACLPVLAYSLLLSFIVLSARFFLERYHGEEMLGYYGTVSTIAVIVQSAAMYIFNPFNGIISDHYANGNRVAIRKLSGKIILALAAVTAAAVAGAAVLGKFVLVLLFGKSIAPYAYLLVPAIFASCLTGLMWFLGMVLTIMRSMRALIIGAATGAAVSMILSRILIPRYVFDGANVAVIAALCVSTVIYIFVLKRRLFE